MVFADKGKGYVHASTTDVSGDVEDMTVDKGIVQIK